MTVLPGFGAKASRSAYPPNHTTSNAEANTASNCLLYLRKNFIMIGGLLVLPMLPAR